MTYRLPTRTRRTHSVTVVIPCYNYGRYLPHAVRCALAQRRVEVRVVIVDDCSTDGSLEIARGLAAADDRVRVIAHETNQGHIRTYNDGLAAVHTDLVTLVSADDLIAPGALDRAAATLERHPEVGLVYGKVVRFGEAPPPGGTYAAGVWRIMRGWGWIDQIVSTGFNPIMSPEAVLRTRVLRDVGGYNPLLPHSGDLEYWIRVAARSDVCQIRGAVQAYYRVHGDNMHLTRFDGGIDNIRQKLAAFEVLRSPDLGGDRMRAGELYVRGARTLVEESLAVARAQADRSGGDAVLPLLVFADEHAVDEDQRDRAALLRRALTGRRAA